MRPVVLALLATLLAGFGPAPKDSPFFKAVHKGDERTVRRLATGKSLFDRDGEGRSPLIVAAQRGHAGLVALFLKKGLDVDGRDMTGNTALHHAAARGYLPIVKALLAAKAPLQVYNKRCHTPLDMAAAGLRKEIYDLLAESTAQGKLPRDGTIEECALKKSAKRPLMQAAVAAHRRDLSIGSAEDVEGAFESLAVLAAHPDLARRLAREVAGVVAHETPAGMDRYPAADLELRRNALRVLVQAKLDAPAREAVSAVLKPVAASGEGNARAVAKEWLRASKKAR